MKICSKLLQNPKNYMKDSTMLSLLNKQRTENFSRFKSIEASFYACESKFFVETVSVYSILAISSKVRLEVE